jgi:hypothetical protein
MRAVCEVEPGSPGRPADAGFRWTVLQRFGRRPLAVTGRVLLRADNRCAGLARWSELVILETAGLRLAASIRHHQPDAPDWTDAWLCGSAEEIRAVVLAHDPLAALPPDAGATAMRRFRGAWAGLLAAVFGARRGGPA